MVIALLLVTCLLPPIAAADSRVSHPFVAPACEYCAGGHRGIEFSARSGSPVIAVADGVVVFNGFVAGVLYIVVDLGDGLRATYGELISDIVGAGDHVAAGQRLATAGDTLYFGLRRGDVYIDPAPLLATVGHRARLVPTDASPARPARASALLRAPRKASGRARSVRSAGDRTDHSSVAGTAGSSR